MLLKNAGFTMMRWPRPGIVTLFGVQQFSGTVGRRADRSVRQRRRVR